MNQKKVRDDSFFWLATRGADHFIVNRRHIVIYSNNNSKMVATLKLPAQWQNRYVRIHGWKIRKLPYKELMDNYFCEVL